MDTILSAIDGRVGILTFNRPDSLNSITAELADDFQAALTAMEQNDVVNIIVLTGAGKAFCAGGDLYEIKALPDQAAATAFVAKAAGISAAIRSCPKPIIAMVNGAAAGAGFNIALACDLIFAADNAKFTQSFSNVGLVPDCGGHYFLPKAIGTHLAKQAIFEAEVIGCLEGYDYGFVNEIYSRESLKEETMKYAAKLAKRAPLALREAKRLLNSSSSLSLNEVLEKEAELQGRLIRSEDCQEGIKAFINKREPNFTGK